MTGSVDLHYFTIFDPISSHNIALRQGSMDKHLVDVGLGNNCRRHTLSFYAPLSSLHSQMIQITSVHIYKQVGTNSSGSQYNIATVQHTRS